MWDLRATSTIKNEELLKGRRDGPNEQAIGGWDKEGSSKVPCISVPS